MALGDRQRLSHIVAESIAMEQLLKSADIHVQTSEREARPKNRSSGQYSIRDEYFRINYFADVKA